MFFKTINAALSGRLKNAVLAIAFIGDNKLTVVVTPTLTDAVKEKAPHLATPFVLTGTPEELDAEFAKQFEAYDAVHSDLQKQVDAQIKAINDESEAKKAAGAKKTSTTTKTVSGKSGGSTSTASTELQSLIGESTGASTNSDGAAESDDEGDDVGQGSTGPIAPATQEKVDGPLTAEELF